MADTDEPFIASSGGFWRERYASVSPEAFRLGVKCDLYPERPLRALLVGHNPSDHAWQSGVFYSNPSNNFWRLMRQSGALPAAWRPHDTPLQLNNAMPGEQGLGITDYILAPGSDAAKFSRVRMISERAAFHRRLEAHARRAGAPPRLVVFVGKKQWKEQFEPPLKTVQSGLQTLRPPGWPFPHAQEPTPPSTVNGGAVNGGAVNGAVNRSRVKVEDADTSALTTQVATRSAANTPALDTMAVNTPAVNSAAVNTAAVNTSAFECQVMVLTSPSGRAAMSKSEREAEYACFARLLENIPLPPDGGASASGS
mmetsp:Transcript_23253/g.72926  ORF Transcript_23253/g.72926 Transcript_23253/m.72926 type:complete len:311 (-) Transcript_23253:272-1204(-)